MSRRSVAAAALVAVLVVAVSASVLISSSSEDTAAAPTEQAPDAALAGPGGGAPEARVGADGATFDTENGIAGGPDLDGDGMPDAYADQLATLKDTTTRDGGAAGLAQLDGWMADGGQIASACHNQAHIVGRTAALTEDAKDLITIAPASRCDGGFMHGVLQTYAVNVEEQDLPSLGELCKLASEDARTDCVHGTGHLLTVRWHSNISEALQRCLIVFDDNTDLSSCAGGVAMEYATNYLSQQKGDAVPTVRTMGPAGPVTVTLSAADLADPCSVLKGKLEDTYIYECYTQVAPMWFAAEADAVPAELVQRCATLPGIGARACALGVGAWSIDFARIHSELQDDGDIIEHLGTICFGAADELADPCIVGVVGHAGVTRDLAVVESWCAELPASNLEACMGGVASAAHSQERMSGALASPPTVPA